MDNIVVSLDKDSMKLLSNMLKLLVPRTDKMKYGIVLPSYYNNLSKDRKEFAIICRSLRKYTDNSDKSITNELVNKYANIGRFRFILFEQTIPCKITAHDNPFEGTLIGVNHNKEFAIKFANTIILANITNVGMDNDIVIASSSANHFDGGGDESGSDSLSTIGPKSIGYVKSYKQLDNYFSESTSIEEGLCE